MNTSKGLRPLAAAILAAWGCSTAFAGEAIEFDNGMKLSWRANASYGLSMRQESPDPVLAGSGNGGGNDGNNNFKNGAITSNRLGLLVDATLSKGDSGFVVSGSTFYDQAYRGTNDNAGPVNKPGAVNEFTPEARRYHGGYSRFLDAYGYTSFQLGERSRATVRLGRHVVSWGEALFFPGISLAQGPADGTKTGIPGTETKDQLLPEDQISGVVEVNPNWSLMGHAQYSFHETIAPAPGSYLSTSDAVGPGGSCLGPYVAVPAVPGVFGGFSGCSFGARGSDIRPGSTGQWGLGTRYRLTNETEVGLYYLNYHDRSPLPEINAFTRGTTTPAFFNIAGNQIGNGSYRIRYFDNVKLLGSTVSTTFGAVTVGGELSHKMGAPVLVNTVVNPATRQTIPNPTRADVTQLNLNAFANVGRTVLAPSMLLLGEISTVRVSNVESRQAPGVEALGAAAAAFPSTDALSFSKNTLAVQGQVVLGYPGITESWDLSVPISYSQQLKGRSLTGGVGGEGDRRVSIGATFTYKGNFQIALTYLGFLGSPSLDLVKYRALTDRDQVSLVTKYSF